MSKEKTTNSEGQVSVSTLSSPHNSPLASSDFVFFGLRRRCHGHDLFLKLKCFQKSILNCKKGDHIIHHDDDEYIVSYVRTIYCCLTDIEERAWLEDFRPCR
jgi:hypothetical protein